MAELTVETGSLRGQTVTFSEDDTFVIGSGESCSLRLHSPGVAEQHLVIKALKNGGFGIKKLEGRFTLNGRGTEAARLTEGDILEVADTRLRFGPKSTEQAGALGVLGGYRMIGVLGKGGHGTVYRAEQMSLHRNVALKVLPKETTANPEFVGRFVAEARAAARLSHPNVVQVFDVGHDGDTYFLSMEIMEHGSLEDRLRRDGKIPVEECLRLMLDAAEGLSYAESMRIVHRDIKPDNLMVDSHDTAKIADLGLALSANEEHGRIVGTPHFMSPEQATGKPLDHRSDLYSLGCSFFRLVTGRTLFQRPSSKEILRAHVKDEPESADAVDPEVPRSVAAIIDRLVEKDPDERYQSAQELIDDLNHVLHPPAKKGRLLIAGIVVLLAVIGYMGWYAANKDPTIIQVGNGGDPAKLEVAERKLRESNAETERLRILRNVEQLDPLSLADRLQAFATAADSKGTRAAARAVTEAREMRDKETARVAAETARNAAIDAAHLKLQRRATALLEARDYRALVAALAPEDIAADILGTDRLKALVKGLRARLLELATTHLAELTTAIDTAKSARDPAAMLTAIDKLAAILEAKTGWPDEAFADRAKVAQLVSTARVGLEQLRKRLAAAAEAAAEQAFYTRVLAADGILAKVSAFDTKAAVDEVDALLAKSEPFAIAKKASQLAAAIKAAEAYYGDFQAAIAADTVKVAIDVGGATTEVVVKSFDPATGLTVLVTDGERLEPTKSLNGNRLRDVFRVTKPGDSAHAAGRLAFLALHGIAEHLGAAIAYMDSIDPSKPDETGAGRFTQSLDDLNYLTRQTSEPELPWQAFLGREVIAAQTLSRGLQAFSTLRYTAAHRYLDTLPKKFKSTIVVHRIQ